MKNNKFVNKVFPVGSKLMARSSLTWVWRLIRLRQVSGEALMTSKAVHTTKNFRHRVHRLFLSRLHNNSCPT